MIHQFSYSNILYRLRGADGELLYIGITRDIPQRMRNHRYASRAWFGLVASIETTTFPSYFDAWQAEGAAIRDEKPQFNVYHTGRRYKTDCLADPFSSPPQGERIAGVPPWQGGRLLEVVA